MFLQYIKAKVPKITARTRTKITKKIYSSGLFAGQRKFKNYPTKKEAAKVFSKINQWGFQVEDSGDVSKGWKIIFVDNKNGISQHATMYACRNEIGYKSADIIRNRFYLRLIHSNKIVE